MSIVAVALILIPIVSIAVAFIALQIFLSLRPNKWLGLILPGVHFLLVSMIFVIFVLNISIVAYGGESNFITMVGTFLLLNIPVIVDLVIYIISRRSVAKRNEVDKMKIQDL